MTQEEQRIYYEKALADAIGEYKHVSCLVDAIRMCVTDIDFEEKFPVSQERSLIFEKMKASEGVQTNLRNSIRFYRAMLKANKPEPWEEDNAIRTVEIPCGPVRVVNTDKASKEELDGMMHHCGQDAHRQSSDDDVKKLEQLIGARVRLFHAPGHKCSECPYRIKSDGSTCNYFKVETASGYYLCLAWSQQDERPVISFDEEEQQQEETTRTIMDGIREQTKAFMDYLDSVVKG